MNDPQVDELREEFERRWRAGEGPTIEQYLRFVPESSRLSLLAALVRVELTLDASLRHDSAVESYCRRFPDLDEQIRRWATELRNSDPAANAASPNSQLKSISPLDYDTKIPWETPNPPIDRLPQTIGEYEIEARLGEGGMGLVYRARHRLMGRKVAIKIFAPDKLETGEGRFLREMQALGALEHPNLVRAYDAGRFEGRLYLVQELVDGKDLRKLLSEVRQLAIPDACQIIQQVCYGLQHLHDRQWIHRDIKPANIMITSNGIVKLVDLGLARLVSQPPPSAIGSAQSDDTMPGYYIGTADFMAPEQIEDASRVDIRADLYAAGCTLFNLLIGQSPFGDQPRGIHNRLWAHVHMAPRIMHEIRAEVPVALSKIVDRLLAKSPRDRFGTPMEVANALSPFVINADLGQLYRSVSQPTPEVSTAKPPLASEKISLHGGTLEVGARTSVARHDETSHPTLNNGRIVFVPASARSLSHRPETQVILRVASGRRAGEVIGVNANDFMIGESIDNDIDFDVDVYPGIRGVGVRLRYIDQGWVIQRLSGMSVYVNTNFVEAEFPVRSGDIVRLSLLGPDLQFLLPPGQGSPIREIVSELEEEPGATLKPESHLPVAAGQLAMPESRPSLGAWAKQILKWVVGRRVVL